MARVPESEAYAINSISQVAFNTCTPLVIQSRTGLLCSLRSLNKQYFVFGADPLASPRSIYLLENDRCQGGWTNRVFREFWQSGLPSLALSQ